MTAKGRSMTHHIKFLTRVETARRLAELHGAHYEPSTLAKKAHDGGGPPYRLICGRAMYIPEDVDRWAATLVGQLRRKASETDAARTAA
jgi:hypothetical protein